MSQSFDRALALLDNPGVRSSRATTIVEHNAILGHAGTHVVQTACATEEDADDRRVSRLTVFLQVIDQGNVTQVVIPDKVARTILRQIRSASARPKKPLTPEQRRQLEVKRARQTLKSERERRAGRTN